MPPRTKPEKCICCKERIAKDEPVILDMYARVWCESCVIEYLGDFEPR